MRIDIGEHRTLEITENYTGVSMVASDTTIGICERDGGFEIITQRNIVRIVGQEVTVYPNPNSMPQPLTSNGTYREHMAEAGAKIHEEVEKKVSDIVNKTKTAVKRKRRQQKDIPKWYEYVDENGHLTKAIPAKKYIKSMEDGHYIVVECDTNSRGKGKHFVGIVVQSSKNPDIVGNKITYCQYDQFKPFINE